jgi:hypothetical protein
VIKFKAFILDRDSWMFLVVCEHAFSAPLSVYFSFKKKKKNVFEVFSQFISRTPS